MTIKTIPIFLPDDRVAYITAGPTSELPPNLKLIRCAAEIPVEPDRIAFDIGTRDFKPFDEDKVLAALPGIMDALRDGQDLYVGCMGGTGRTGTLLAILAAQHPAMDGHRAIDYIRQVYKPGAVETGEQEEQVDRLRHCYMSDAQADRLAAMMTSPARDPRSYVRRVWDALRGR